MAWHGPIMGMPCGCLCREPGSRHDAARQLADVMYFQGINISRSEPHAADPLKVRPPTPCPSLSLLVGRHQCYILCGCAMGGGAM